MTEAKLQRGTHCVVINTTITTDKKRSDRNGMSPKVVGGREKGHNQHKAPYVALLFRRRRARQRARCVCFFVGWCSVHWSELNAAGLLKKKNPNSLILRPTCASWRTYCVLWSNKKYREHGKTGIWWRRRWRGRRKRNANLFQLRAMNFTSFLLPFALEHVEFCSIDR